MPFVLVLPFIVIGIVIAAAKKAEQMKRAEAQNRERQLREQGVPQPQPTQVRPAAQAPKPVREGPRPGERVQPQVSPRMQKPAAERKQAPAQMHQGHDFCALRPDSPKGKTHPDHDLCSLRAEDANAGKPTHTPSGASAQQCGGIHLNFTQDQILNGVILSEILGKPKALR